MLISRGQIKILWGRSLSTNILHASSSPLLTSHPTCFSSQPIFTSLHYTHASLPSLPTSPFSLLHISSLLLSRLPLHSSLHLRPFPLLATRSLNDSYSSAPPSPVRNLIKSRPVSSVWVRGLSLTDNPNAYEVGYRF